MKTFVQGCFAFPRFGFFLSALLLSTILPSAARAQAATGSIEG